MTPSATDAGVQRESAMSAAADVRAEAVAGVPDGRSETRQETLRSVAARPRTAQQETAGVLPAAQSMMVLIVIAIFIITFCAQPFRIPSESMESTLLVGDFLLVNKVTATPDGSGGLLAPSPMRRGDIIVFHDQVDTSMHLVKRVVGLPGDRLRLHGDTVYINGRPLEEPYAVYRPGPPDNFRDNFPRMQSTDPDVNSMWWIEMRKLIENGELIIPANSYFVLGDNRNDSEDSRYWGFVPRSAIIGKPLLIYFSLRTREDEGERLREMAVRRPVTRLDAVLNFARWGRMFRVVR